MSLPTSTRTFEGLILRVAELAKIAYYGSAGNERAMIPINAHDLDLCKRAVNDAISMFISDSPPNGWRWMRRTASVTLTGTRITGTVDSGSATTVVDATLSTASGTADDASATTLVDAILSATYDSDDDLNGYYCYILTGTGAGSYAVITDYTASTGTITVADWLTAGGLPGGTDPVATDTFGISASKILVGYYCYITAGTGKGSYALITAFDSSDGTLTVADWLDSNGNADGTDPTTGSTFAITPVETVGGDRARYPLPENVYGEYLGGIEYEKESNHATPIVWRDERTLRRNRAVDVCSNHPLFAAIRPLEPVSNALASKRRFELFLDPQPNAADVVEFPYILHFDELRLEAGTATGGAATTLTDTSLNDLYPDDYFNGWAIKIISGTGKFSNGLVTDYAGSTGVFTVADWLDISGGTGGTDPATSSIYIVQPVNNYHPAGPLFDQVILTACKAKAEQEWDDIAGNFMTEYFQKDLLAARMADLRNVPKQIGSMNKGTVRRVRFRENVTYG